jgi:hypothetical protein
MTAFKGPRRCGMGAQVWGGARCADAILAVLEAVHARGWPWCEAAPTSPYQVHTKCSDRNCFTAVSERRLRSTRPVPQHEASSSDPHSTTAMSGFETAAAIVAAAQ